MERSIAYIRKSLIKSYSQREIDGIINFIFSHVYNYSKYDVLINSKTNLPEKDFEKIVEIVSRLKKSEPIQYILGRADFYGLIFRVNPNVLIPRGETEELVDRIVKKYKGMRIKVLDVGTGSGCIAVSLKKELPSATIHACDISEAALEVARQNASGNGVSLNFFLCDVFQSHQFQEHEYDVVVSNPPYVCEKEKNLMEKNVLDFEPGLALFVPDDDPLRYYRALAKRIQESMKPDGLFLLEINEAFGQELVQLFEKHNFDAAIVRDIHGKDRMIEGRKKNNAS